MRMARFNPSLVVAGICLTLAPAVVAAQGVTVTSNTSARGSGFIGAMMKLGGGGGVSTTTTYVSGHKLRTDGKDYSTIIDVDAGRFTNVNHKNKTYTVMTFEQMAAMFNAAADSMKVAKAKAEKEAKGKKQEESNYEMDYSLKVDPTGERQKVAGYDATRTFLTITMGAHEKGKEARADEGKMALLVDTWSSTSAPNATAMREFQRAYAQKMGREFSDPMRNMAAVFNSNPQMKQGLEAAGKELAKQQGVPLRSTTYFILVPEGMTLDRQLAAAGGEKVEAEAKGEEKQEKKGGLFGKLKAAAAAAQQKEEGANEKGAPQAKQSTLLTMLNEVQEIKSGVPSDAFSIPAGYKQVEFNPNRGR